MRYAGSREDARRRRAAASPEMKAVLSVVHRVGVVLGAALDAAIDALIRTNQIKEAEELRDALKPFVDSLVHFEVGDGS